MLGRLHMGGRGRNIVIITVLNLIPFRSNMQRQKELELLYDRIL